MYQFPCSGEAQEGCNTPAIIKKKQKPFFSIQVLGQKTQYRSRELWIRTNTRLKMMPKTSANLSSALIEVENMSPNGYTGSNHFFMKNTSFTVHTNSSFRRL